MAEKGEFILALPVGFVASNFALVAYIQNKSLEVNGAIEKIL